MKKSVLRHIKRFLTITALAASGFSTAAVVPLDAVVAIVDNDVVMASELNSRMQLVIRQLKTNNTQLPEESVLREQILEQLISESLQLQMAERIGMTVSEAELDDAIQRMMAGNNLTREQMEQSLAADGMTMSALRNQIRRDMLIEQVQRGSVNRRIQVTDQEVKNFLKSKQGQFWSSPDYNLGHILIPVSAMSDEAEILEAKAKAEAIRSRLLNGGDFRQVAVVESAGQNSLQGGDLGWRKLSEVPPLFSQAVENMKAGDISEPLRSGAGFHLLKVYDQRGGGEQLVQQALVRHILIKPSAIVSEEEARQKLVELRQDILNGLDFAEAAKNNSEDVGSMLSGGDLGWSLPGKFVPEFEKAIDETAVGEISEPFQSQFGWHILQVQERRQQDMSETVRTNQATRLLRSQRFEEERFNWLREIRDEAYVEIKI